jgi:hypothetical protein
MRKTTSRSLERVYFYSLPKSTPTFASYPHTHDTGHVLAGLQATFNQNSKEETPPAGYICLVCVLRALFFGLELPLRAYLLKGRGAYNQLAFPFSRFPRLLNDSTTTNNNTRNTRNHDRCAVHIRLYDDRPRSLYSGITVYVTRYGVHCRWRKLRFHAATSPLPSRAVLTSLFPRARTSPDGILAHPSPPPPCPFPFPAIGTSRTHCTPDPPRRRNATLDPRRPSIRSTFTFTLGYNNHPPTFPSKSFVSLPHLHSRLFLYLPLPNPSPISGIISRRIEQDSNRELARPHLSRLPERKLSSTSTPLSLRIVLTDRQLATTKPIRATFSFHVLSHDRLQPVHHQPSPRRVSLRMSQREFGIARIANISTPFANRTLNLLDDLEIDTITTINISPLDQRHHHRNITYESTPSRCLPHLLLNPPGRPCTPHRARAASRNERPSPPPKPPPDTITTLTLINCTDTMATNTPLILIRRESRSLAVVPVA